MINHLKSFTAKNNFLFFKIYFCTCLFAIGLSLGKVTLVAGCFLILGGLLYALLNYKAFLNILKKQNLITLAFFAFIIFSTIATTIWDFSSIFQNTYHYFILPLVFFYLGEECNRKNQTNLFLLLLLSFYSGLFTSAFLSMAYTASVFGLSTNMPRLYFSFATKESLSCTGISLHLIPLCVAGLAVLLIKTKYIATKVLGCCLSVIAFVFTGLLGNRGFFLAAVIALVLVAFTFAINYKIPKKVKIIFISIIVFFILAFLFLYFSILGGFGPVIDFVKKIPVLYRFFEGGSNEARKEIYMNFFKVFYKYPFGGMFQTHALVTSNYVHNSWFDVYCAAGLIPCLSFIYLTFTFAYDFCFAKKGTKNIKDHLILTSLFVAVACISAFEPTIQGNMYFFCSFFAFFGYISPNQKYLLKFGKIEVDQKEPAEKEEETRPLFSIDI